MFKLEADRMANLNLTDEEFAKEIKVVMEERRLRTDDKARALLYEELMATTLQRSSVPDARDRMDERPGEHESRGCAGLVSGAGTRRTTRLWSWWET